MTVATEQGSDGAVLAIARGNGRTFIGGNFERIGPHTGTGVGVSRTTGALLPNTPDVGGNVGLDPSVNTVVGDGAGGFYVGGNFSHVGGVARPRIAHIEADGSLDPAFNPPGATDGAVDALAFSSDGRLYVGGRFTTIGGAGRTRIAELDATTGTAESFNPGGVGANDTVAALEVVGGDLYAGGEFTSIGGQARSQLARLNADSGAVDAYNPGATGGTSGVLALEPGPDGTMYAGGSFTSVDGVTHNRVAQIDANGDATAFEPNANGTVRALSFSHDLLYLGGNFSTVNGATPRNKIAAVNTSGTATGFDPNAGPGSTNFVNALQRFGDTVYVGGAFESLDGQSRDNFAALDTAGNAVTAFNPRTNETVRALAVNDNTVYAGGDFTSVGMSERRGLAALDSAGRLVQGFDANSSGGSGLVQDLVFVGGALYVGGEFDQIGGQARPNLAKLSPTSGNAFTGFNPSPNNEVEALAFLDGALYAGGDFSGANSIGGQTRNHIAKLSATSGNAFSAWNPNANAVVDSLAAANGAIYAGGSFTTIGTLARNRLAKLSATSGNAFSAWNPNPSGGTVQVLDVIVSGSAVYVGGSFTSVGAQSRNNIAKLSATSGNAFSAWNPNADFRVFALAAANGIVYAGGEFNNIGTQPRAGLAALSATSGNAFSSFNPGVDGGGPNVLSATTDSLYAGGQFARVGNFSNTNYAQFTPP